MSGDATVKVTVWGHPYSVSVHQKSKSVWIAAGDYMGETLSVQDRTRSAALTAWKRAATAKGN
jgi:hypothetical protein